MPTSVSSAPNGDLRRRQPPSSDAKKPAEFQGSPGSTLSAYLALFLWLGFVHFTIASTLFSLLFLPFPKSLIIPGVLLFFEILPINEQSKWGRKVARFIFKNAIGYFPVNLYVEDMKAFDPNEAYVFGYEPHSIWPIGLIALADVTGFMCLPKIKALSSNAVFRIPFMRHIWAWSGAVRATRENFISLLESGYSCIVVPGGIQEVVHMQRGSETCYLKNRKGFVRVAIQTGKPLVPVFCFGQSEVLHWWKPKSKLYQEISRAIKVAPVFFWGVFGLPVPLSSPMHVVVGQPIVFNQNPQPTTEEVDDVHGKFVDAIQDLFERHKSRVGYKSHLTIL